MTVSPLPPSHHSLPLIPGSDQTKSSCQGRRAPVSWVRFAPATAHCNCPASSTPLMAREYNPECDHITTHLWASCHDQWPMSRTKEICPDSCWALMAAPARITGSRERQNRSNTSQACRCCSVWCPAPGGRGPGLPSSWCYCLLVSPDWLLTLLLNSWSLRRLTLLAWPALVGPGHYHTYSRPVQWELDTQAF